MILTDDEMIHSHSLQRELMDVDKFSMFVMHINTCLMYSLKVRHYNEAYTEQG